MLVRRRSPFSRKIHEMELPITEQQMEVWQDGMLIQDAMPHLNDSQREFVMTGITPAEWKEFFGE